MNSSPNMRVQRGLCSVGLAFLLALGGCRISGGPHGAAVPSAAGKKLIKLYGLDKPSPGYLREHIAEIEQVALDGICIVAPTDETKPGDTWRKDGNYLWFTAIPLERDDFAQVLRDLNATPFKRLHYNFLHYAARGPGNPGWFDDTGWAQLLENTRVAGWLVSRAPFVGITFDCEYGDGGIWNYAKLAATQGDAAPPFEAWCAQARARGRAWAQALSQAAPDVIICLSHGYWVASPKTEWWGAGGAAAARKQELADQLYALYPPFLDGVLEGLGPNVQIVDGCESTYPTMVYDTFRQFRNWAHTENLRLSAVPDLVRTRMQYAMAVWPGFRSDTGDMWNPDTPEKNFFTPERLSHALHNAMAASDRFAWIWNGRDIWWPMSVPPKAPGEQVGWGVLRRYPEVYRQALADSRQPRDLAWRPLSPDRGSYTDTARPALCPRGKEVLAELPAEWWFKTEPDNVLFQYADTYSGWTNNGRPNLDEAEAGWNRLAVGRAWEEQGVPYNGSAWYRVRCMPPAASEGRRLWLAFGGVANQASVFAAPVGMPMRRLGNGRDSAPFLVEATGAFLPGRETLVAIRVINPDGPGGILSAVTLLGLEGEKPYQAAPGRYAVLDLDFSRISGRIVPDRSGFGNHATLSNCELSPAPDGGSAVRLNGGSSVVQTEVKANLNPWNGQRSWELWYSPGGPVPHSPIVYHVLLAKHPAYSDGLYLAQNSTPNRVFFIQGEPGQSLSFPFPDPNAWYHLVATSDGAEMRLYVNGALTAARRAPIPPAINGARVTIGGGAADANRCAPGLVARAAVYNYALSAAEVAARYKTLAGGDER